LSRGFDTLGGDLLFHSYANLYGEHRQSFGGHRLAPLPRQAPTKNAYRSVVVFGCDDQYKNGLYNVAQLTTHDLNPNRRYATPLTPFGRFPSTVEQDEMLSRASLAVIDPACYPQLKTAALRAGYAPLATRGRLQLMARPRVAGP
jgi:hypothetical protein